ncbi:MAG: DNA methyltransferase [Thermodesulfobacteriota bacterium]|nr:DNA methyltransferase [Thermodesulfobacteriota bacterium]
MKELPGKSVHLVITSPPYWQLKDYTCDDQIGFNDSYEDYINNLNLVWQECYRVLNNGCRLCINIGDQFARSAYYARYKVIPIRTEIIKFCESIGFDYMGAIIWQKKTTTNTSGGASIMGSFPFPRNGIISIDYEFILLFKKLGAPQRPAKEAKESSRLTKEEWKEYFSGHWNFGGARQDNHIAVFPEELPRRLIKMFSFVNDTILDPFLGSGTTTLSATKLDRNSVGYEINQEYIPLINKRLHNNQSEISNASHEYIEQDALNINFGHEINKLPYIFRDFHSFDKKIDPKKLQFGSKIDKTSNRQTQDYYYVKKIISPELVMLSNDITVRLIGIRKDDTSNGEAVAFLELKTKNQKVYMKFDRERYDADNNLLCYLYLKNRTFLNAHLIKNKLAQVDERAEYKYKAKFKKLGMS